MVGSPFQTEENLLADLRFLQELDPDMIGIGPFLPHHATPFAGQPKGDLSLTLRMLALTRLMFPHALLPATTALGTLHPNGRVLGLKAGGNVVMPNLSPTSVRKLYTLYEDKISTDEEAAEGLAALQEQVKGAGYRVVTARGDVKR
jgi:biotin synthase